MMSAAPNVRNRVLKKAQPWIRQRTIVVGSTTLSAIQKRPSDNKMNDKDHSDLTKRGIAAHDVYFAADSNGQCSSQAFNM